MNNEYKVHLYITTCVCIVYIGGIDRNRVELFHSTDERHWPSLGCSADVSHWLLAYTSERHKIRYFEYAENEDVKLKRNRI